MLKLLRDSSFWALVIAVLAILTGTLIVYRNLHKQNAAALAIIRNGNCIDQLNELHALELSELLTNSTPNYSEKLRSRVAEMQGIWTTPQDSVRFQEIAKVLLAAVQKKLDPGVESNFQQLATAHIERIDRLSTLRRQYFEENLNAVIVLITTAVGLFLFSIWSISRTMTLRRKKNLRNWKQQGSGQVRICSAPPLNLHPSVKRWWAWMDNGCGSIRASVICWVTPRMNYWRRISRT